MSDGGFDPIRDIANSQVILVDGAWPNFHDAEIHELELWSGDIRPEDDVWLGPTMTVLMELCALEEPFLVRLRFSHIEGLELTGFATANSIGDLRFDLEPRGSLRDGSPLTPWIRVAFDPFDPFRLSLKCMRIEVIERLEIE